jgi:uncharacterized membrane protein YhaH (DUF805 family)
MNSSFWENDYLWLLVAAVVVLVGFVFYKVSGWIRKEQESNAGNKGGVGSEGSDGGKRNAGGSNGVGGSAELRGRGLRSDRAGHSGLSAHSEQLVHPVQRYAHDSVRPFSFNGRIGRLQFFSTVLVVYALWLGVLMVRRWLIPEDMTTVFNRAMIVLIYISFNVLVAQGVKRCHDLGHSGRFMIVPLYVLPMLLQKGQPADNEYGTGPLGGSVLKLRAVAVVMTAAAVSMQCVLAACR